MGVPWLGWTCGSCAYCLSGRENLCDRARFTGYHRDGSYADYTIADARFCFPLPATYDDVHAAPLLCAGLIGHRALPGIGRVAVSAKDLRVCFMSTSSSNEQVICAFRFSANRGACA